MGWLLFAIGVILVAGSAFCLGSWFGYDKGERDTIERMEFYKRKDGEW